VRAARGFTLIEAVMVIVILGVLAVMAVPRFLGRSAFDERGYLDELKAATRHAQRLAIATGCDVRVSIDPGGYALETRGGGCTSGAFSVAVDHPAKPGAFSAPPPASVSIGATVSFHFDKIGRPRDAGGTLLGAAVQVPVGGYQLTVEPETGLVRGS